MEISEHWSDEDCARISRDLDLDQDIRVPPAMVGTILDVAGAVPVNHQPGSVSAEHTFHVDMCPDCGAVPFQHPMDAPWYCDHPRDRYVMVECAPTDHPRGAVDPSGEAILRELAQMPLTASGKDFDRLVKAAREYLPEYGDVPATPQGAV